MHLKPFDIPANGLVFYTEGSLFEVTAGSGVYSEEMNLNLSFFHGCHATVFQTEIHAILACSEFCKSQMFANKTVCICSDSRAALLALSSYSVNSKLVLQCWKLLQELSVLNTVLLFWVPGHRGIPGNEEADTLAGAGSKQFTCGLKPYLPVSRAITKLKINNC
jgi:ribonuclease HI